MKRSVQILKEAAVYFLLLTVLYLFYKSVWVITLLLPCMVIYRKIRRKDLERERKRLLDSQFKDMLESLVASLRAGYSVENGLKESLDEMVIMYGEDSLICDELHIMLNEMHMGITVEKAFDNLAQRSGVDDISTFASVFTIAKRSGGDMADIIRKTTEDIAGKIDTRNEIAVLVSSKKLEQNIMSLMPAAMILYINLSSGEILEPMYGNIRGVIIMTICLVVYAAAVLLGRKIMNIEV